jgi:putative ABC transport system permease protein
VLLSHALWQRRFSADRGILDRTIVLDGEPYTVVGVLPADGPFDRASAQIWRPLAFDVSSKTRDFRWLGATAKLKPGVTLERARAEMDVIGQRLANAYPESNKNWGVAVDRLTDVIISQDLRIAVTVLFAGTVFVWLIGCANLANLALARSIAREGEMAVRAALGASRWRLMRQLLIENVVISMCGGVVGLGVGYALLMWIRTLIPASTLPPAVEVSLGAPVLLFTLILAVATGLLFGVLPAARITNAGRVSTPKVREHGTTTGSPRRRLRNRLVIAEIALAFVLLAASGLLMRSSLKLLQTNPGFDPANVLTAGLPVTPQQHPDPAELNAYLASVSDAVGSVSGVSGVAMTSALPLEGGGFGVPYAIAGRAAMDSANRRRAFFKIVSPSYVGTLGITLRAGRMLSDEDRAGAPPVALINETLARREFPDENPIGRRILVSAIVPGRTQLGQEIAWEIVGVIAGEKISGLGDAISAGMYVSNQQSPTYGVNLVVRSSMPPESLQKAIRSAIGRVNTRQALSDIRTLEQIVDQSMRGNRVVSTLLAVFAAIALLLAALGIYGVIAYTALQRTHEMGIRGALGATPGHLRWLIFLGGARLTLVGLAVGFAGAFVATHEISAMLYGVDVHDPVTFASVTVVLAGVAGLASVLPAWKIAKVDPLEALRHQ